MEAAQGIEAECTWDLAAWRRMVRHLWIETAVCMVVTGAAGVTGILGWSDWLAWVVVAWAVQRVAIMSFLIWKGRDQPVKLVARSSGLHLGTVRGQYDRTWEEVQGFRGAVLSAGIRLWAPHYTTGGVSSAAVLVLKGRHVSLEACPADQRERMVWVVEQHLAARQAAPGGGT